MLRAIERGLALKDFEDLTVGMIVGFITTYNNERMDESGEDAVRAANQADFDCF